MKITIKIEGVNRAYHHQWGSCRLEDSESSELVVESLHPEALLTQAEIFLARHARPGHNDGDPPSLPEAARLHGELAKALGEKRELEQELDAAKSRARTNGLVAEEAIRDFAQAIQVGCELEKVLAGSGRRWPTGLRSGFNKLKKKPTRRM